MIFRRASIKKYLEESAPASSSQFGELMEPEPVLFSFDAPGWYVLFALLFTGLFIYALKQVRKYRLNKFRRDALQWMNELENMYSESHGLLIYHINVLMKKLVLRGKNRDNASLVGTKWTMFLNQTCPEVQFDAQDEILLNESIYQQEPVQDDALINTYLTKVKRWIQKHKLE